MTREFTARVLAMAYMLTFNTFGLLLTHTTTQMLIVILGFVMNIILCIEVFAATRSK
jgi:hypothetical protein